MCAYFSTKTIRSLYQFNDDLISDWYEKTFDKKPKATEESRRELVKGIHRHACVREII